MSGKVLLDTNIVILLFSEDELVKKCVAEADEVFLPNTVIGELYFGAFNSSKKDNNIKKLDEFFIYLLLPKIRKTNRNRLIKSK